MFLLKPRKIPPLACWMLFQRYSSSKIVLGIETSCDDTACALVSSSGEILANLRRSQHLLHEKAGGIVPNLAMHSHTVQLPSLLVETLSQAGRGISEVDYIAVTRGPGLPGCLAVGLNAAKSLAAVHQIPLLGVHHMMGHALTVRLTNNKPSPEFPYLSLLISGGHTLVVLTRSPVRHEVLANTLDDAIGEAFDKVTRYLGIPWLTDLGPGAALEKVALTCPPLPLAELMGLLPVPLTKPAWKNHLSFSFSGLKTAVQRLYAQRSLEKAVIAMAFHQVVCQHLGDKLKLCISKCKSLGVELKSLVISGGVASNSIIREKLTLLAKDHHLPLHAPPKEYCTDNAAMIAWAAVERISMGLPVDSYEIDVKPIWPLSDL